MRITSNHHKTTIDACNFAGTKQHILQKEIFVFMLDWMYIFLLCIIFILCLSCKLLAEKQVLPTICLKWNVASDCEVNECEVSMSFLRVNIHIMCSWAFQLFEKKEKNKERKKEIKKIDNLGHVCFSENDHGN